MALALYDRVRETTTVLGTSDATLLGAVTGFQSFAVVGNGNTCYYTIADNAGNWEVGLGTYSTTGPTLARTTVYSSSTGGTKVSFPAGSKDIFLTYPAEKAVQLDASGNVSALGTIASGTWQANTVATTYGGTGVTSYSAGDLPYYSTGTALSKLAIGTSGYVLKSNGTAPVWEAASNVAVTTISFSATGLTPATATGGAVTVAGTLVTSNGGTGLSSYTAGDITYYASGTALSKLSIGANKTILTSSGTAPQWSSSLDTTQGGTGVTSYSAGDLPYYSTGTSLSKLTIGTAGYVLKSNGTAPVWDVASNVAVTTFSAGTTGFTPSSATGGAVTLAGTLNLANGGTGATTVSGAQTNLQVDPAGTAIAMSIALG